MLYLPFVLNNFCTFKINVDGNSLLYFVCCCFIYVLSVVFHIIAIKSVLFLFY